ARGYGSADPLQIARRAVQSWDRTLLLRARTGAAGQWVYRLEDAAHAVLKVRHLPTKLRAQHV
ncbi:MAG: hypothetical protein ACREQM_01045, partial [Candidatus Dormibacteraceae bacterium]